MRIGKALIELMERLGYRQVCGAGGRRRRDHRAGDRAAWRPEKIIGIHLNAATIGFMPMGPVSEADAGHVHAAEKARLGMLQEFMQVKFGFNLLQSHQPAAGGLRDLGLAGRADGLDDRS